MSVCPFHCSIIPMNTWIRCFDSNAICQICFNHIVLFSDNELDNNYYLEEDFNEINNIIINISYDYIIQNNIIFQNDIEEQELVEEFLDIYNLSSCASEYSDIHNLSSCASELISLCISMNVIPPSRTLLQHLLENF